MKFKYQNPSKKDILSIDESLTEKTQEQNTDLQNIPIENDNIESTKTFEEENSSPSFEKENTRLHYKDVDDEEDDEDIEKINLTNTSQFSFFNKTSSLVDINNEKRKKNSSNLSFNSFNTSSDNESINNNTKTNDNNLINDVESKESVFANIYDKEAMNSFQEEINEEQKEKKSFFKRKKKAKKEIKDEFLFDDLEVINENDSLFSEDSIEEEQKPKKKGLFSKFKSKKAKKVSDINLDESIINTDIVEDTTSTIIPEYITDSIISDNTVESTIEDLNIVEEKELIDIVQEEQKPKKKGLFSKFKSKKSKKQKDLSDIDIAVEDVTNNSEISMLSKSTFVNYEEDATNSMIDNTTSETIDIIEENKNIPTEESLSNYNTQVVEDTTSTIIPEDITDSIISDNTVESTIEDLNIVEEKELIDIVQEEQKPKKKGLFSKFKTNKKTPQNEVNIDFENVHNDTIQTILEEETFGYEDNNIDLTTKLSKKSEDALDINTNVLDIIDDKELIVNDDIDIGTDIEKKPKEKKPLFGFLNKPKEKTENNNNDSIQSDFTRSMFEDLGEDTPTINEFEEIENNNTETIEKNEIDNNSIQEEKQKNSFIALPIFGKFFNSNKVASKQRFGLKNHMPTETFDVSTNNIESIGTMPNIQEPIINNDGSFDNTNLSYSNNKHSEFNAKTIFLIIVCVIMMILITSIATALLTTKILQPQNQTTVETTINQEAVDKAVEEALKKIQSFNEINKTDIVPNKDAELPPSLGMDMLEETTSEKNISANKRTFNLGNVSFSYPANWIEFPDFSLKTTPNNVSNIVMIGEETSNPRRTNNIRVSTETLIQAISAKDYIEKTEKIMKDNFPNLQSRNAKELTVSGREAPSRIYSYELDGITYLQFQVYVSDKNNIYIITFTSDMNSFKENYLIYSEILKTFRI